MKHNPSIPCILISASLLLPFSVYSQEGGQSGGGDSAAEASVTTSSSQKSSAAPESIESNPVVTVVRSGLPVATALSSGLTISKIVKLAQAGGSISNLQKVSDTVKTSGVTYLTNIVSAAEKGITFKSTEELTALDNIITASGFVATSLDKIKTNQDAGITIAIQDNLGVDAVSNAVSNGDSVETITALSDSVKDLDEDAKAAAIASATVELSDELKAFKQTLSNSITVSDPVKSNLNLAINSVLADADYTGMNDLQISLTNAVIVANLILADATVIDTASLPSAINVESLSDSGYNTELIKLLIKYGAIGSKGSTLATEAIDNFSSTSTTSDLLTVKTSSSNYLGLLSTLTGDSGIGDADGNNNDFLDPQKNTVLHVSMDKISLAPGSKITIGSADATTTIDVSTILKPASSHDDRKVLIIGAAKDLTIAGDTTFINDNDVEDHALVLGSAGDLSFRSEANDGNPDYLTTVDPINLEYTGSNLGLGSEDDLYLVNVNIKTGGNLAIGTLSDLNIESDLENTSVFSVGTGGQNSDPDNVYMYANELISVNGLAFAGRVDDVYMDAITIDLANVTFPENADVTLRSRDGGLNILSLNAPDIVRTVGDVNFIDNVKHLSISETALTSSNFDYSKGDGHINSTSALPNGTPHIKIRSR